VEKELFRKFSMFALFGTMMLKGRLWNTSMLKRLQNHLLDSAAHLFVLEKCKDRENY